MSKADPSTEPALRRDLVAVGHPGVRHPVQGRAPHQQLIGLALEAARTGPRPEDYLERMLLECPTSQVFVTSDNPVILLPPPGYFDGMNVSFMNAPVLFPISPKRALLLSHLKGIGVVRVWGRQMKEMVDQTITYGHKAVFSNIASEEFQEIFDSVPEGDTTKAYSEQRN